MNAMKDLFDSSWNPVEVKTEMAVLLLPFGAVTAGVRRGPRITIGLGRAVKL